MRGRPLIESTVRELCRELPKVTFLERTEVTALQAAGEPQRSCTGVDVRVRDDGSTRTLDADFVVDASGAHSRAADWLRQLELEVPEDDIVDGYSGYSSRWFRLASAHAWPPAWWWKVVFLRLATPAHPYFIAFFPIEDHRWLLSYIGVNRVYPPTREEEFTAALAQVASPVIQEMVRRMEPISPVYPSRATQNRWRHYERWRRPLGRFVALADAACAYNPRFGQGMSAAAVCARVLHECLRQYGVGHPRLPERFFAAQAQVQRTPWLFAAGDDLRLPATEGHRSVAVRLFNWYRRHVAACTHPQVGVRVSEVTQLVRPLSALVAPPIVWRVVGATLRRQLQSSGRHGAAEGLPLMPPDAQASW
jgi:2-polyprenyl-6-methoxyphenol hydroxylase-like FAD-dependent oxidoreductase